jgi:hypothetical protein
MQQEKEVLDALAFVTAPLARAGPVGFPAEFARISQLKLPRIEFGPVDPRRRKYQSNDVRLVGVAIEKSFADVKPLFTIKPF